MELSIECVIFAAMGIRNWIMDLLLVAALPAAAQLSEMSLGSARSIEIVVHRGANALAPENTWASADSALRYGASWIEVDVRKSKDGELFNLHDATLDRTTNGKGLLSDMLAEDVRQLDAGSWFGEKYKGLHVPTIAEMLDSLQGRAKVFFDVKRGTPIPILVNLVREKGFADKSFFWFGDEGMLREFISLAPEMKVKVNASNVERLKYWQTVCTPLYVEIAPEKITDEFRSYCHQHGIKVMAACQEDDTSQFQLVIDKKADLVNLDRPEVFVRLLTSCQAKPGMSTHELQSLIDQMSSHGGGRVVFGKGRYLTGQLELKSGVELHLEEGAELLGSTSPFDYLQVEGRQMAGDVLKDKTQLGLIVAKDACHISITGKGTIDGQGLALALTIDSLHHTGVYVDKNYNFRRQRPSELVRPTLFNFVGCQDVRVEDVHLRNSAGWGLSFHHCRDMVLRNLDIFNRAYWNNDGIDLTDCQQVLVENCNVNSADDGICLKSYDPESSNDSITIRNCEIRSSASAIKVGTASYGGFRHIRISGIRVFDTFRSALAIESVDGALIEDVEADDIIAKNTGNALFIRLGQRGGDRKGVIRNVRISNMTAQIPFGRPDEAYDLRGPEVDFFHNPFPSSICGIPGNCIENVTLEDINITYPGRATKGMAYMPLWRVQDVPEQINKYPEFTMFGELPSWGFYLRHLRNLVLRDVRLSLSDSDFRPAIVDDDVEGLTLENVVTP